MTLLETIATTPLPWRSNLLPAMHQPRWNDDRDIANCHARLSHAGKEGK